MTKYTPKYPEDMDDERLRDRDRAALQLMISKHEQMGQCCCTFSLAGRGSN